MKKTLGGDRLGSGKKIKVDLHNWGRSTFNQSRKWRSTMACGALIPCFTEIGLNGTTFKIDINAKAHTIPTIAPLFGSFKMQIDLFACPIRLYQGLLHNNMTKIGLDMSKVLLPKIMPSQSGPTQKSSLLNYLGLKGINGESTTEFNAIPVLAYYDIFKNYYANKQEENAKVIAWDTQYYEIPETLQLFYKTSQETINYQMRLSSSTDKYNIAFPQGQTSLEVKGGSQLTILNPSENLYFIDEVSITTDRYLIFRDIKSGNTWNGHETKLIYDLDNDRDIGEWYSNERKIEMIFYGNPTQTITTISNFDITNAKEGLQIRDFKLENIDKARQIILKNAELLNQVRIASGDLGQINFPPYNYNLMWTEDGEMQGLVVKTYQSDMYTNWLSNENIELINEISAVSTGDTSFSIDALILAKKVYNMLNRIAVSGGTYEDWQEANYGEKTINRAETPIYIGGFSSEIEFDEVVSTAETTNNPLATLAGKGIMTNEKRSEIIYKCDEPCYIMGIVSITPRIDYADGNKWYLTELQSMDDFHKPGLDGIGFQNLMASNLHWKATGSLGKQPAWINYQTAVDEVFGNFAKDDTQGDNQSYMVLKRQFEVDEDSAEIKDFTSYIDPVQYNYAFADNRLESQNFWVQIGFNVESRRKMAAYEIPNL